MRRQRRRAVRGAGRRVLTMARGAAIVSRARACCVAAGCGATVELRPGAAAYAPTHRHDRRDAARDRLDRPGRAAARAAPRRRQPDRGHGRARGHRRRVAGDDRQRRAGGAARAGRGRGEHADVLDHASAWASAWSRARTRSRASRRRSGWSWTTWRASRSVTSARPTSSARSRRSRPARSTSTRHRQHGREAWAAAAAIDEALDEAVRTFAPRIYTPRRPTLIVEVPPADAGNLMRKLETLQRLYPELSLAQVQALADSRERFLVVEPGAPRDAGRRARGSAGCARAAGPTPAARRWRASSPAAASRWSPSFAAASATSFRCDAGAGDAARQGASGR